MLLICRVPPKAESPKSADADPPEEKKTVQERLTNALRDARVKFLEGLKSEDKDEGPLYQQLQVRSLQHDV